MIALLLMATGCGRSGDSSTNVRTSPDPRSDRPGGSALAVEPPPATGTGRPARTDSGGAAAISPGTSAKLPEPSSAPAPVPAAAPAAGAPELVAKFTPPVLRQPCSPGRLPGGRRGEVELELRVNEDGVVDQFRYASGSADTSVIRAALDCVRVLRFDPATRGGKPVPAWCRQRFTFPGK